MNHIVLEGYIIDGVNSKVFANDKYNTISCQISFPIYIGEGKGYNNTGYENCFVNINYKVWNNGGTRFPNKTKVIIEGELRQSVDADNKRHTRINVDKIKQLYVAPKPQFNQDNYYQPVIQQQRPVQNNRGLGMQQVQRPQQVQNNQPIVTEDDAILFDD